MQLGFSLSNKKHAGDAQTMPFRECSFGGAHGKIQIFHWKKIQLSLLSPKSKHLSILVRFVPLVIDHNPGYKS